MFSQFFILFTWRYAFSQHASAWGEVLYGEGSAWRAVCIDIFRQTPSYLGRSPFSPGYSQPGNMVNTWLVSILFECILVADFFCSGFHELAVFGRKITNYRKPRLNITFLMPNAIFANVLESGFVLLILFYTIFNWMTIICFTLYLQNVS